MEWISEDEYTRIFSWFFLKGDLLMHQQPVRSVDLWFRGNLGFLPTKRRCHVKMRYLMYQLNAFFVKNHSMSTWCTRWVPLAKNHWDVILYTFSQHHSTIDMSKALQPLPLQPAWVEIQVQCCWKMVAWELVYSPPPKILTRKPLEGWWFVYRCFSFCRFGAFFKLPCQFVFEVYPYEHFYGIGVDTLPWFHTLTNIALENPQNFVYRSL